jgi:hypothetical protein
MLSAVVGSMLTRKMANVVSNDQMMPLRATPDAISFSAGSTL